MSKGLRQTIFILFIILAWEIVARWGGFHELLFPSVTNIFNSFIEQKNEIILRTGYSLYIICIGFLIGTGAAVILSAISNFSKYARELVNTLMGILHPLPAISILPLVLLWFGTGKISIIVLIIFSSVWPLTANFISGLRSVPLTQLEVGRNIGLKGINLIRKVMIPSALLHIITGFKVGWARAWQSSVAAEMVFGASGNQGGIGWLIYKNRFMMEIPGVFAGLVIIILIGVIVENIIISSIENKTIRKWGMTTDVS